MKHAATTASVETLSIVCFIAWCLGAGLAPVVGIWIGIGSAAIGLGIVMWVFARPMLASLLRPTPGLVAEGAAAAAVMIAATYLVYPPAHRSILWLAQGIPPLYALFRSGGPAWLTRAALPLIIIGEELVWRGVVMSTLLRRFSPIPAILGGATLYALAHAAAGSPTLTLLALGCGLYWSALRVRSGSLIPSLICHVLWDCSVLLVRPLS